MTNLVAPPPTRFTRFAACDWSGARGESHPGIALAVCLVGDSPPDLVDPPGRHWSRGDIAKWLADQDDELLIGFDFSFAPPFVVRGAYLPGDVLPETARSLWAYVDQICHDPDMGAASFLETHHRRHFYFGAADGRKADYMHLRACEAQYNASGGGKPSTVFDVIGAAQVAKASFAGMRMLHHVGQRLPVWPFDQLPPRGPVITEIYTQIAARAAGLRKGLSKIRNGTALDNALAALGSRPHTPLSRYTDHATDAIISAAWLRAHADHSFLWTPAHLTAQIAQTEGWTFGII